MAGATVARCCEACGAVLVRHRWRGGANESLWDFARRRFCNKACAGRSKKGRSMKRAKPLDQPVSRCCEHCGAVLVRHRWKNGTVEPAGTFAGRRFCGKSCLGAFRRGKPHQSIASEPKICEGCGGLFDRRPSTLASGGESITAFARRRFCTLQCHGDWVARNNERREMRGLQKLTPEAIAERCREIRDEWFPPIRKAVKRTPIQAYRHAFPHLWNLFRHQAKA